MGLSVEDIFEELKELKQELSEAKQQKSEKKGQLSEQLKSLKTFDVDSVVEAKKEMFSLKKRREKGESDIISGFEKLREKFEW